MKKILTLVLLSTLFAAYISAHDVDYVCGQLEKMKTVEKITHNIAEMDSIMQDEFPEELKGLKLIRGYDCSDCDEDEKQLSYELVKSIKEENGYKTALAVKEKDTAVKIMVRSRENVLEELLLIVIEDDEEVILIRFLGEMDANFLDTIIGNINIGNTSGM